MYTKPPKALRAVPYLLSQGERSSTILSLVDNLQGVHFTTQTASNSAMLTASTTKPQPSMPLSLRDRQLLISGLIGEYEYLCHDDGDDKDMTPAQNYAHYVRYTDAELIDESMVDDVELYESCRDFYNTYSSYIPEEYSID